MHRVTRRRRILVVVIALSAIAACLALLHPGLRALLLHLVEPRDRALVAIQDESDLKAAFNAHPERIRVVAWLSPT